MKNSDMIRQLCEQMSPIYDRYVDEALRYFRNRNSLSDLQDGDLKEYVKSKGILIDFSAFYGLDKYSLFKEFRKEKSIE